MLPLRRHFLIDSCSAQRLYHCNSSAINVCITDHFHWRRRPNVTPLYWNGSQLFVWSRTTAIYIPYTQYSLSFVPFNPLRSANLMERLYVLLALIFYSFNDRLENNCLGIYWTDFRNLFTKWQRFGCRWSDWTSFSDISRDVAMATNFVEKWQKLPSFVALAFQNGMGYHYLDVRINSASDASISCENFVNFGPVTPELTELICERLVRHAKQLDTTSVFQQWGLFIYLRHVAARLCFAILLARGNTVAPSGLYTIGFAIISSFFIF